MLGIAAGTAVPTTQRLRSKAVSCILSAACNHLKPRGCCVVPQGSTEASGMLGASASAGVLTAPRLQAARLPAPSGDLHLLPRPRGAFSDLVAVPVDR